MNNTTEAEIDEEIGGEFYDNPGEPFGTMDQSSESTTENKFKSV